MTKTILLAALAALALAATAAAKETNLSLSSTPSGLGPGNPWNVVITVEADPPEIAARAAPPVLTIRNLRTGEQGEFEGQPVKGKPGSWEARVVFPAAGTYDYTVEDGITGRAYEFDPVTISAPATSPPVGASDPRPTGASAPSGDEFPLWPVLGLTAGALFLAAGLAIFMRRRRPQSASA